MISDYISIDVLYIAIAVLILVVIIQMIMLFRIQKKYISFMKKMGNGTNLDELLRNYIKDVQEVCKDNDEIKKYYSKLDYDLSTSIQKVGLVRYNAFENVGSDLSFALAMLDRNNNGVVINGIYGSQTSNIYAKPIKNLKSSYKLSDEEEYAIEIAEKNKNFISKNRK